MILLISIIIFLSIFFAALVYLTVMIFENVVPNTTSLTEKVGNSTLVNRVAKADYLIEITESGVGFLKFFAVLLWICLPLAFLYTFCTCNKDM